MKLRTKSHCQWIMPSELLHKPPKISQTKLKHRMYAIKKKRKINLISLKFNLYLPTFIFVESTHINQYDHLPTHLE